MITMLPLSCDTFFKKSLESYLNDLSGLLPESFKLNTRNEDVSITRIRILY